MKKFYKVLVPLVSALAVLTTPMSALAYSSDYQIKGVPDRINGEDYNFAIGNLWSPTVDKLPDDNRTNKVIIWSLYQGEDPYIMEERDDGSKKKVDNPHYAWVDWNKRALGVKVRNSRFEYEDGKITDEDNLEINIDYSVGGTEVMYNSESSEGDHYQFLLDNLKNTGNNDKPALYRNVYYVENGEYLFSTLSSKDIVQPKGAKNEKVENIQSYVVVPTSDKMLSPFIEDGYNETALENEWVVLDGDKTVTVYAMFGSPDWCYDNLGAFRDWIAAAEGEVNPYEDYGKEEEAVEEVVEEEEEIDPEDVPISKPVIVEEPVEEVDKTDSLVKLIILTAVLVALGVGGFIFYKKWKKKNDEYL